MPRLQDLNPLPRRRCRGRASASRSSSGEHYLRSGSASRPIVLLLRKPTTPGASRRYCQQRARALALSGGMKSAWSASIGTGSSFYGKLTASPIVYDGKVITSMRPAGHGVQRLGWTVAGKAPHGASQREGARRFWRWPRCGRRRVYAATGFGVVVAFDAKSGKKLWEKNVGAPVRASQRVRRARIRGHERGPGVLLSGSDGTELWNFQGQSERASILSTPARLSRATPCGALPQRRRGALRAASGQAMWSESLARSRTALR